MRKVGLEPTRCNHHKILSLARLPVPTLPQENQRRTFYQMNFSLSTSFLKFFLNLLSFTEPIHADKFQAVLQATGLEPARGNPPEPKSGASANSAMPADLKTDIVYH